MSNNQKLVPVIIPTSPCDRWRQNPTVNPYTGQPIGPNYQRLIKECKNTPPDPVLLPIGRSVPQLPKYTNVIKQPRTPIKLPINPNTQLRLEQDYEYYQSLYDDIILKIRKDRAVERERIELELSTKVPTVLEDMLTRDQQRLIRVFKLNPNGLTPTEKANISSVVHRLEHMRAGGCYNIDVETERALRQEGRLFTIKVPNVAVPLCVDVLTSLVNDQLQLADVIIILQTGDVYRYPLSEAESDSLIRQVEKLGESVGELEYPQSAEAWTKLQQVIQQLP